MGTVNYISCQKNTCILGFLQIFMAPLVGTALPENYNQIWEWIQSRIFEANLCWEIESHMKLKEKGQNSTVNQKQWKKYINGSPSLLPPVLSHGAGGHSCSQSRLRTRTLFSPSGYELEFASTFRVQLSRMSFPLSAEQHQYFQKICNTPSPNDWGITGNPLENAVQ